MKLLRAIRILLWLPFVILSNLGFLIAVNLAVLYLDQNAVVFSFIVSGIVRSVAQRIEPRLRPPKIFGPPMLRPLVAGLVKAVSKVRSPSPGKAAFSRGLSPQLKALLRRPADQKPAALLFEERKRGGAHADRVDAA